jgi:hypothetical protein
MASEGGVSCLLTVCLLIQRGLPPALDLAEQGATLRKKGDSYLQVIPASKVERVVLLGNVNITTAVIHYLLAEVRKKGILVRGLKLDALELKA